MRIAPFALAILTAAACSPAEPSNAQGAARPAAPASAAEGPRPTLAFPADCVVGTSCEVQNYVDHDPGPGAKDYRCGVNTYEAHGGVDIRLLDLAAQKAGVDVLAAAPGRVTRLRDGVADVSVKARGAEAVSGQECGNGVVIDHGGGWETQYCHLAMGSVKVKVGDQVGSGQPIARIGLSGNTEYSHLHVTVRRAGTMVDPFAPDLAADACDASAAGAGMWATQAAGAMAYKPGAVLNTGFSEAPVSMEAIEAGSIARPGREAGALVAYVRAINLQKGDVQRLTLTGPDGSTIATSALPPLDRSKAQYMMFVGKKRPGAAWAAGDYRASYEVERGGRTAVSRSFSLVL